MNGTMRNGSRLLFLASLVLAGVILIVEPGAGATAPASVDLGTASAFAVLGGQSVTNTGPSVINGDLGVSPGTSLTGVPPGVVNGTVHAADAVAAQAQADLTTAYDATAGQAPDLDLTGQDLGGQTLAPGVYNFDTSSQLTGTLTLDAEGVADSVFVFQIGSTLTTASNSTVSVINGAEACNVFWQVGSSATLGTTTTFVGNVLALTSITAVNGTNVQGRLLAQTGSVTLDTNVVTPSTCVPTTTGSSTGGGATTSVTASEGGVTTTTSSGGGGGATTTTLATGAGGGVTTTTIATGGRGTTTTPAPGVPANNLSGGGGSPTTIRGGGPAAGATGAASTGNSSPSVIRQTVGSSAASPGATSGPASAKLAQTGGRSPLITLALGLLVLVAGVNLEVVSRRTPALATVPTYR
jgi:hypothetical protein